MKLPSVPRLSPVLLFAGFAGLLFLSALIESREASIDIQLHDTYLVMPVWQLELFGGLYFLFLGLLHRVTTNWVSPVMRRAKWLHVPGSILPGLFFLGLTIFGMPQTAPEADPGTLYVHALIGGVVDIFAIVFLMTQILFLLVVLFSFVRLQLSRLPA